MVCFYDTNILLENNIDTLVTDQKFFISSITIEELENIKTSNYKDEDTKYKARQAINWLVKHENLYEIILYQEENFLQYIYWFPIPPSSNDLKIILTACYIKSKDKRTNEDFIFKTQDLNCYFFAKYHARLNTEIYTTQKDNYTGYSKIFCSSDEEMADLYNQIYNQTFTQHDLKKNEYILIYDKDNNLVDKYKYQQDGIFNQIKYSTLDSKMFGKIKPMDIYQELAIDSFKSNQLTLLRGPAGTGKSLLSMAYLFQLLQEGQIDKIIIFCNTVATIGSAKLGYYPGKRVQKLLDSQIGNFLISKLGAREEVEKLINNNELVLLPMSDIRGFDTTGMRAGIYITEAQNLNINLMRLALQRIGEDSICILDGDDRTQVDSHLYTGKENGMKRVSEVFRGEQFYGQVTLQTIHRSKITNIANKM